MKNKLTSRLKLFIVIASFAIFAVGIFGWVYSVLERRNTASLDDLDKFSLELEVLKKEQKNFEQGQNDLRSLEEKPLPPKDLFSADTKVVKEIKVLEDLAQKYGLEMTLSISGSNAAAVKAEGLSSELTVVPYTLSVEGHFENILTFVKSMEHVNFVTQTKAVQLSAAEDGKTMAVLSSQFYLKK